MIAIWLFAGLLGRVVIQDPSTGRHGSAEICRVSYHAPIFRSSLWLKA